MMKRLTAVLLTFALLAFCCCAAAGAAEADWRIFENNLCLKDSDAAQNAEQVLQRDLYAGTVNGMEFTVTEAGYDGRSLFLRFRYRIPEAKNAFGVRAEEIYGEFPPDGLKPDSYETGTLTEEGNELRETKQIGSWWYQFLINGKETGPSVGATQAVSGSDVPGEIFETYYLPLYKDGIFLDGQVRISLPAGDALPENDVATFELDTKDILSLVRTFHPEQGAELSGFTVKVKEAAFSPLLTNITVETELKPGATENDDPPDGSVGIPLLGNNVKIIDSNGKELPYGSEGEVCLTGPTLIRGYFNNQELTDQVFLLENGERWIHTGDLGYMNEDGIMFIAGRIKRMIIRHDGFKVIPRLIEDAICIDDNVKNCAVVGKNDLEHGQGQLPVAFVVLKDKSKQNETEQRLQNNCWDNLPEYEQPSGFIFIDELPLTPIGKVDYKKLEEYLEQNI